MNGVTNIPGSGASIVINQNQITSSESGEAVITLKNGDTIKGTILEVLDSGGEKTVNISVGENVISAKLSEGMSLREGQTLSFAVKSLAAGNVSITPLYENTSVSQSTIKALDAAGIEVNNDTIEMVKDMMELSLPINKEALQEMGKNLTGFPNTSISTMVEMKSLNIPITENNIQQFESYKNYEHQVVSEMENIIEELPSGFNALVESGESASAMKLYGSFLKIFSQENGNAEAQVVEDNTSKAALGNLLSEADDVILENKASLNESLNQPALKDGAIPGNDFIDTLKNLNISEDTINKFVSEIRNGNVALANKELLKELSQAFEQADLTNNVESASWKKLFTNDEFNKTLKQTISSDWLLKPSDVENKDNIQQLYQRLQTQVKHLSDAVNNTLGAESKLGQAANNLQNNLDFMNQINQMFQYVQLPLQMSGQNAHGDLYVYKNKNKKISEDGSVSAILHLDMEHLGPLDVYVKMIDKKVTTNFYVSDESVMDLIEENVHILNERLEKRGYAVQVNLKMQDDEFSEDAAVDEMFDVTRTPLLSTASFDARA